ncbi:MAG: pilin [Candidatus Falkowbacteria bacterium]|nr:pilin [Candidatus Falkowbacteria bacterium]
MKKNWSPLISLFFAVAFFLPATVVLAAVDTGVAQVDSNIALSATDPRVVAVRIINFLLMFLGIIAVSLVIYGGFVWMTSDGNDDRIALAKKILKNALIGLVIILASWGITAFILSRLAAGVNGGNGENSSGGQNYQIGLGAVGACVVENFYPNAEKANVPRNSSIMVTFKEPVDPISICRNDSGAACACSSSCNKLNPEAIQIFKKDVGNSCGDSGCNTTNTNLSKAIVGLSFDKKTIVVIPQEYLGEANVAVPYGARFTNQIKNLRGENIFSKCQPTYLEWNFTVNGLVDLVPPIILNPGVFPAPDNERDTVSTQVGQSAVATIEVLRAMGPAKDASFLVAKGGGTTVTLSDLAINNNYQEVSTSSNDVLTVTAIDDVGTFKVSAGGRLLGSSNATKDGAISTVNFTSLFSFKVSNFAAGNSWTVTIGKPHPADGLTIGGKHLSFPDANFPNFPASSLDLLHTVALIQSFFDHSKSDFDLKTVSSTGHTITLIANPGAQSNDLGISSSRPDALTISQFSGGGAGGENVTVQDRPDQPMNSAIQINFSKEMNPLTLTGPAEQTKNTIYLVNAGSDKKNNNENCVAPGDCLSYKCESNKCVGDFVQGTFTLSSDYKSLEFLSDNECGVNGCGEKIYCLPANSNLKVILLAADLDKCTTNTDCSARSPFNICSSLLSYKSCTNPSGKYYPASDVLSMKGVFDASSNSFSGNRDSFSDGPVSIFNGNTSGSTGKDNFQWSFFISDKIIATAPLISSISPTNNSASIDANTPVSISFNRLMLNSSLLTGSKVVSNGKNDVTHKFLNIRSFGDPAGYWIGSSNLSSGNNGVLDRTIIKINHSVFSSASTFNAQAGSGVRDIYQNCYKPSGGASCTASDSAPSCCFGSPTANLGDDGNCK